MHLSAFKDVYRKHFETDQQSKAQHLDLKLVEKEIDNNDGQDKDKAAADDKEFYNFVYVCHDLTHVKKCAIHIAGKCVIETLWLLEFHCDIRFQNLYKLINFPLLVVQLRLTLINSKNMYNIFCPGNKILKIFFVPGEL